MTPTAISAIATPPRIPPDHLYTESNRSEMMLVFSNKTDISMNNGIAMSVKLFIIPQTALASRLVLSRHIINAKKTPTKPSENAIGTPRNNNNNNKRNIAIGAYSKIHIILLHHPAIDLKTDIRMNNGIAMRVKLYIIPQTAQASRLILSRHIINTKKTPTKPSENAIGTPRNNNNNNKRNIAIGAYSKIHIILLHHPA